MLLLDSRSFQLLASDTARISQSEISVLVLLLITGYMRSLIRLLCPIPRACPISCFVIVSILLGSKLDDDNNVLPNGSDVNIVISILLMKPLLSRLMYDTPCVDNLVLASEEGEEVSVPVYNKDTSTRKSNIHCYILRL